MEEIEQLIRMAQVLKMRSQNLVPELHRIKRGDLAGTAVKAAELAAQAEQKLIKIGNSLRYSDDA